MQGLLQNALVSVIPRACCKTSRFRHCEAPKGLWQSVSLQSQNATQETVTFWRGRFAEILRVLALALIPAISVNKDERTDSHDRSSDWSLNDGVSGILQHTRGEAFRGRRVPARGPRARNGALAPGMRPSLPERAVFILRNRGARRRRCASQACPPGRRSTRSGRRIRLPAAGKGRRRCWRRRTCSRRRGASASRSSGR